MRRSIALLVLLPLAACRTAAPPERTAPVVSAPTMAERVVGRWQMDRVLDRGNDATDLHNPAGDRYVELRADGTFESGGQPYGRNTGRWTFDPGYNELILESDLGDADDSYWIVSMDGDEMEWAGVRSETARRFRIFSRRVGR